MLSSEKIMRNIILASILEPIPDKKWCTTRYKDCSLKAKLEYFLIAWCNIGYDFYTLSERIKQNKYKQPSMIYDIAYNAQLHSYQNRNWGKVNFGIIELLVPIVTAQLVYNTSWIDTLKKTQQVIENTSKEDIKEHYKFRLEAKSRSTNKNWIEFLNVKTIKEYFEKADKNRLTDKVRHTDYISWMKFAQTAYQIIISNDYEDILGNSVIAYDKLISENKGLEGLVADNICIGIYLALCDMSDDKIII